MRNFFNFILQNPQVLKRTFRDFSHIKLNGQSLLLSISKYFTHINDISVSSFKAMTERTYHGFQFSNCTLYNRKLDHLRYSFVTTSYVTQIMQPSENYHALLTLPRNKSNMINMRHFLSSPKYCTSKSDGISDLLRHKPHASLKSKKRISRKKTRNIAEASEEKPEEFQITRSGRHKFLTFDPEFAIPDITVHKPPTREFQAIAYATADEYDLETISQAFHKQGLYITSPILQTNKDEGSAPARLDSVLKLSDPEDVLYLNAAYQLSPEPRAMFIFREGSVVFWNMPSLERKNILKFIKKYQSGSYSPDVVEEEAETLIYAYTDSSTRLKPAQSTILLNEKGEQLIEKYTFSNALAMSVKLGIWEASLDRYVENIEHVTEKLQESGAVILSQEEVLQKMGQLFALRHLINLSSDLLDTPDFYWEHETLGNLYNKTANYLNIQKRTSVMNTKLSHCLELMELLKSHLNERHSSRLEWIIIILILIEVFFEVIHLALGLEK